MNSEREKGKGGERGTRVGREKKGEGEGEEEKRMWEGEFFRLYQGNWARQLK